MTRGHAPLELPPGVDKRPPRGARLPPVPSGHSARAFAEPQTARGRSENPRHVAASRRPQQRKMDINALLAQLQAFREAKGQAVELEDYTEAARLKQLITEIEATLEQVGVSAPPPGQPSTQLAGSIYDGDLDGMVRKPLPPMSHSRNVPLRSPVPEESSQKSRVGGGGTHLRDASEAAQACVPPPKGGRKPKDGPVVDWQPESHWSEQDQEEAYGFETEDLLQGIVERNLLVHDGDIPSSADTVEDVDAGVSFGHDPAHGYHATVSFPVGPAPTLDDLLLGNAKKVLRPVKEPTQRRHRPKAQRNGMNHVPVPPPLPKVVAGSPDEALRRGLEDKDKMHRRLDAIDKRHPLTAR